MKLRMVWSNPPRYYRGNQEITAEEYEAATPSRWDSIAKSGKLPFMRGDKGDWAHEKYRTKDGQIINGRYCPQAADFPGDPKAVFQHREDLCDWAERRGKIVDRD